MQRDLILATAREQFLQFGFSKVTMDEIASRLGMSKKTLYRYFPAKKALLEEAILDRIDSIAAGVEEIVAREDLGFAERLGQVVVFLNREVPRPSDVFLRDLERTASDVWRELERRRHQTIGGNFLKLFRQGREQGALQDDVDPELLVLVVTTLVQQIIRPETLAHLPLSNVQALEMILKIMLLGTLTPRGREEVKERWPSPQ